MPSLKRLALAGALVAAFGCRRVATRAQCGAIVDRYVELAAREADAGDAAEVKKRVREAAEADEDFRSCATHVEAPQVECAMRAQTTDAIEKCLE